jgi:hypothetical protein
MNLLAKLFPKREYECETCDSQFSFKQLHKHCKFLNESGRAKTRMLYGNSATFAYVGTFSGGRAYCPKCCSGVGDTSDYERTVSKMPTQT